MLLVTGSAGCRCAQPETTTALRPAEAAVQGMPVVSPLVLRLTDPKNDAEGEANRQAADDYDRQEEESDALLRLAEGLPPVAFEVLLEQVRLGLATTGPHVAPPQPPTDDAQVVVDWLTHSRLDRAALDMVEAAADPWGFRLRNADDPEGEDVRHASVGQLSHIHLGEPPPAPAGHPDHHLARTATQCRRPGPRHRNDAVGELSSRDALAGGG
ncbi:hypothetical protein J3S85_37500 [Streptomyces lavenduligriseus]|nr:hypothetical protein J3S85_37500 [Streptomyces lavenduligriseus]